PPHRHVSLYCHYSAPHSHPPSFPTRRSSDLSPHLLWELACRRIKPAQRFIFKHQQPAGYSTPQHLFTGNNPDSRGKSWPKQFNLDRKSTRLNSSHVSISYAVFCLKTKKSIT